MLQLILGRAGTGKTEYVFSTINNLVNNGENNILLITPEQYSFIAERRLLSMLKEDKVNCVENSSFSRLNNEISRLYGGDSLPTLSKGGKAVMMQKAVNSVKDFLQLFNNNTQSSAFISSIIDVYDEMKSCRVSVDDIANASKNTDKEILSKKLSDIATIISAYDSLISDEYYDSANELTRLYEKLVNLDYFRGRTVFIDGFSGFVAQEYKILEVIINQAKNVYITLCSDSFQNNDKYDLFSYVNNTISILKDVTKKANSQFLNPIVLDKNYRASNDELRFAEKYTFSDVKCSYDGTPENIKIYKAKNISDECDWTSLQISKLLRQGYKASDISVITRDLDKYEKEIEFSFNKYSIPYFNDERQAINTQPLVMFVNFLLRIMIYNFRSDDIFSLLKTGMTALDSDSISALENYVFLWNINGSLWKNEFTQSTKGFVEKITDNDAKALKKINYSRDYVVSKISKFVSKSSGKSCIEICKNIYYTLLDFSADKMIVALAKELDKNGKSALSKEQERIWELLMHSLDQLAVTMGDEIVTIEEFYKLFNLVISNEDLGTLPTGLDNVQIGCADRLRCDNPKAVFILGANEGEFPQAVTSAGLLTENDRCELINNDFKLYSYGEVLNAQERYFAYMALSSAKDKLFVSYKGSNDNSVASSIVVGLKAVFGDISEEQYSCKIDLDNIESAENAFEILSSNFNVNSEFVNSLKEYFNRREDYSYRVEAVKKLFNNDSILINNQQLAKDLFGEEMYLSASRIEDYYNCAFRYFCKFGLNARPRKKAEMDPMQKGTVIHYVLEQLIKDKGSVGLAHTDDAEIVILVNRYLKEYLTTKMGNSQHFTPRFNYQFMRLSRMLISVVKRLKDEFMQSDFEAKAFELEIGEDKAIQSKIVDLNDGGKVLIKGAVDRVDTYSQNGKKYIRVVDYKSGTKDFALSDVMNGLNLQMFVYLYTICNSDSEFNGIPAGVLYMHSSRNVFNLTRKANADKIRSKETEGYRMKGIVLNDEENNVIAHMEHDLSGEFIPVKSSGKGLDGNLATLEELGLLSNKIDNLINQMGVSLHNGKISQNPVFGERHEHTCEYCDYNDVCMNRKEIEFSILNEYTNNEVFEKLKEEC